jgi:hypothetical protein
VKPLPKKVYYTHNLFIKLPVFISLSPKSSRPSLLGRDTFQVIKQFSLISSVSTITIIMVYKDQHGRPSLRV